MCDLLIRNGTLLALLCTTLDGHRLLQMCQDYNFLKLDPIEKRLSRIENVSDAGL